jgi:hypothetical protein
MKKVERFLDIVNQQIIKVALEYLKPGNFPAGQARQFLSGLMAGICGSLNCTIGDALMLMFMVGPSDVDVTHVPPEWLGLDPDFNFRQKDEIPTWKAFTEHLPESLSVENLAELMDRYMYVVFSCARYHMPDKFHTQITVSPMHKAGGDYQCMFQVFDRSRQDDPHRINWHGQNMSQWLFAGAIVMSPKDDGTYRISIHT